MKENTQEKAYKVLVGQNGLKFVDINSVDGIFHTSDGNSKTGDCLNYNLPIEYSCDRRCECYKSKACYACHGCYQFSNNQALYSENFKFFMEHTSAEFISAIDKALEDSKLSLMRYFTIGDIPNRRFLECMIAVALDNPNVKFWSYTKKYAIVNSYVNENSHNAIPANLTIIFSHWLNDDGTYFPMDNPYSFPTSEFIPLGMEELVETVTHVCPCSNPEIKATCATCDHPCYSLKHGESMALLEHSTKRTKARDKAIKAAHDAL